MAAAGLSEGIHTLTSQGRHLHDRIACAFIDFMEGLEHFCMRLTIKVNLVQDYGHGDVVHLACNQDPVQERELDLGIVYGGNYECAVKIGCDDMRLTRQVGGLADYVILSWLDCRDCCRILQNEIFHRYPSSVIGQHAAFLHESVFRNIHGKCHMVTHSNRVGRSAALKPDLSSEHSREKVPTRELSQKIMASGVLYYCRLSIYNHGAKIAKSPQKTPVTHKYLYTKQLCKYPAWQGRQDTYTIDYLSMFYVTRQKCDLFLISLCGQNRGIL